jgi:hypothetical protein
MEPAAPALLDYHQPRQTEPAATRSRLLFFWLTVPAAIVPFASFVRDISPLVMLRWSLGTGSRFSLSWGSLGRAAFALLFFLWPAVLVFRLRLWLAGRVTSVERIFMFILGGAALAGLGLLMILFSRDFVGRFHREWFNLAAGATALALASGMFVVIAARRPRAGELPMLALATPLLAHSVLSLVAGAEADVALGWFLLIPPTIAAAMELVGATVKSLRRER